MNARGRRRTGPTRSIGEREFVAILAAISATTALGIDMALPAFGEIRAGLGLAPASPRVALTVTLYFLGLSSAQMLYGPFADRFGRKPVLYFGLGLYGLGALGSALAPTFEILLLSRFVWGVGAAGPRALTLAIGRDLYDGDRLARILALAAAVFMVVPALAPLLGQGVLALSSWRWVMATPHARDRRAGRLGEQTARIAGPRGSATTHPRRHPEGDRRRVP